MSDAKALYKEGLGHYGQQKYEDAIASYRAALEADPEFTDCLHALGMSQLNAGKLQDALETLLEVTKRAPNDPLAFTSLSMAYVRLEKIEEAEDAQAKARMLTWKEELKTNPNAAPPPSGGGPM